MRGGAVHQASLGGLQTGEPLDDPVGLCEVPSAMLRVWWCCLNGGGDGGLRF